MKKHCSRELMNKPPTRKLREKHCSRELMNKPPTRKLREKLVEEN